MKRKKQAFSVQKEKGTKRKKKKKRVMSRCKNPSFLVIVTFQTVLTICTKIEKRKKEMVKKKQKFI